MATTTTATATRLHGTASLATSLFGKLVLAGAVVTGMLGANAQGVAAASTTYTSAGFHCQYEAGAGRVVTAVAPRSMTSWYGGTENVRWQPVLYRYTTSGWVVWQNKPGSLGIATSNGLINNAFGQRWISAASTSYSATYWDFANLPAGSYAIREYYGWDASPNGASYDLNGWGLYNGNSYCYFPN